MKKYVVILLVLILVGCSNNNNLDGIKNIDVEKNQVEIETDEGQEVTVAKDIDESIDLPDDYPKDIIPVYDDANVIGASSNPDGSLVIMCVSDQKAEEIIEFYKKVLEEAEVTMEQNAEGVYLNMGSLEGLSYTVSVSDSTDTDLGYISSFSIIIMEEIMGLEEEQDQEETSEEVTEMAPAELVIPDTIEWPEDYPEDIVPAYDDAYTEVKITASQGGQTMVGLMTEDKIDIVTEYYSELLKDASDYSTIDMQGTTMIAGTIDGVMITVLLVENDGSMGEDERFKTLIQVIY